MLWWKRLASSTQVKIGILLFLAALGLRVWYSMKISSLPLNQDESALLLNARLIATSGMDEWGKSWPFIFRSFGDAKLPGYIYTTALLWKFIPTDAAVRIPSFIAGLVVVFLTGLIAWKVTKKSSIGLITTVFLLGSPWTYHYSSVGFEAHLGLALLLLSISLWLQDSHKMLFSIAGSIVYFLACITYNAPLLLFPVISLSLFLYQGWKKSWLSLITMTFVFILAVLLTFGATQQKQGIVLFQDAEVLMQYPLYREQFSGIWTKILGNQWVYFSGLFLKNIIHSFSWEFLVQRGGSNPWHGIPLTGHVHAFIFIALPILMATLLQTVVQVFRKKSTYLFKNVFIVGVLLFGALLPAAITTDAPHATRSLFFFVMLSAFSSWQYVTIYEWCKKHFSPLVLQSFVVVSVVLYFMISLSWYFSAHKKWENFIDPHWYQGLEDAVMQEKVEEAQHVYIEDPEGVLYTRVANVQELDSSSFFQGITRSLPAPTGLVRVEKLGKFVFVFQRSEANPPGVYLEQTSSKEWSTIEL